MEQEKPKIKIELDSLLTLVVEGYLFNDVENMLGITLSDGQQYGAAGYPVVMAINAGIELLGSLQSRSSYDKNNGRVYFCDYWQLGLHNINPRYSLVGIDELVYNLVRHGIAHIYAAKLGIKVSKDKPDKHLEIDFETNTLQINIETYYSDFKKSYFDYFKLTSKQNGQQMQLRLNEIVDQYGQDSNKYFNDLYEKNQHHFIKKPLDGLITSSSRTTNASTPWPPTPNKNR